MTTTIDETGACAPHGEAASDAVTTSDVQGVAATEDATGSTDAHGRAQATPRCPGCHFGCNIEHWQCARGRGLHAQWLETGELPRRRRPGGPGGGPQGGPRGGSHGGPQDGSRGGHSPFTPQQKVTRLLTILPKAMQRSCSDTPESRLLSSLQRREFYVSVHILSSDMGIPKTDILETAQSMQDAGLVEVVDENGRPFVKATEAGQQRARTYAEQREEAMQEFLSPLSADELEQLAELMEKILQG